MNPKNNFLNTRPSVTVNSEPERAEDLATTDDELESAGNKTLPDEPLKEGEYVTRVNDAEETESLDSKNEKK